MPSKGNNSNNGRSTLSSAEMRRDNIHPKKEQQRDRLTKVYAEMRCEHTPTKGARAVAG